MKPIFTVEISKFKSIKELPNAWTNEDYLQLLEAMEYGDTSDIAITDLKEMCMMSLSDNEPDEAAKIVLDYIFKDRLNNGQTSNLSHEIIDEKIWEEYADLSLHEEFYNVGQLLYQAYNGKFPVPEAVTFEITIGSKKAQNLVLFKDGDEAVILRLLAKGMPSNTLLNRLFKTQLTGETFEEAKHILWQIKKTRAEDNRLTFEVISSAYWFHDLKFITSFEGTTHEDELAMED
jgi:hypothetical protein